MTQYLAYPDYMHIYDGTADVYKGKKNQKGAWKCYTGNFLSFAVVFTNITNIQVDPSYQITPANTVPDAAKACTKDYGAPSKPYLTPYIGDTWQGSSKLVPMLFGAGRGRSSTLQGGDWCGGS